MLNCKPIAVYTCAIAHDKHSIKIAGIVSYKHNYLNTLHKVYPSIHKSRRVLIFTKYIEYTVLHVCADI